MPNQSATLRRLLLPAIFALLVAIGVVFFLTRPTPSAPAANPATVSTKSVASDSPNAPAVILPETTAGLPSFIRQALRSPGPAAEARISAASLRWMDEDLAGFTEFVDELDVDDEDGRLWATFAPALMAILPDVSEATANSPALLALVERVIANFAATDPVQALVWAREWLLRDGLDAAFSEIAPELATVDPVAASSLIGEITAAPKRLEGARGVGFVLGDSDPDFALTWVDSLDGGVDQAYALSGVIAGMAENHTERAARVFADRTDSMQRSFTDGLRTDRESSGTSLEDAYEGLSATEAAAAEANLPDPTLGYVVNSAGPVATELTRKDPNQALAWARSLTPPRGRGEALAAVYEAWMSDDPSAAYQAYRNEPIRDEALANSVFTSWAARDPIQATQAAQSLAAGPERAGAIAGVALGWIEGGAQAESVARWSSSLPSPSDRDRARAVVAAETAFDQPVLAWNEARQITNATQRDAAFREIFPTLVEADPQAARRALASTGLPPVEVEYYQSMIPASQD